MRPLSLKPQQIIVPFEFLVGSERMLRIYFHIVRKGAPDLLPPVLVARPTHSDRKFIRTRAPKDDLDVESFFAEVDRLATEHDAVYLVDGNHRAVAAALCRRPVAALEIERDADLEELEAMVERGDYFDLPAFPMHYFDHEMLPTQLGTLITTLEERHLGKEILTLDERTRRLAEQQEIPAFMARHYRSRRRGAP